MNSILSINDVAPDFNVNADGGDKIQLSDLRGKNVILYFYPKDDTPGCTKEAIAFTDHIKDFEALNTVILGVSKDTVAKHDKFIAKHELAVRLLSDETGEICENYGVWVEKSMYGRQYMGIERSTFLIDSQGKIAHLWPKVKVKGHVEEVLSTVRDLKA